MPSDDFVERSADDHYLVYLDEYQYKPHIAVSIYSTVTINVDTCIVESCYVTVTRHPHLSFCGLSCSISSENRIPGDDPNRFTINKNFLADKPTIKFPKGALKDFLDKNTESRNCRKVMNTLIQLCHRPALEGTLSMIKAPTSTFNEDVSEEMDESRESGCKAYTSRHATALISQQKKPKSEFQRYMNTFLEYEKRQWEVSKHDKDEQESSKAVFRIRDSYAKNRPDRFDISFEGTPSEFTQKREREVPPIKGDPNLPRHSDAFLEAIGLYSQLSL